MKIDTPLPEPERGVFETMLVLTGRPVELDPHLARMEASLSELYGLSLPPDARELVFAAAADTELGRLRLDVSPQDGNGVRVADVDPALVFPPFGAGLELRPVEVPGWNGAHKWADRRLLEHADAEAGGDGPAAGGGRGRARDLAREPVRGVRRGARHAAARRAHPAGRDPGAGDRGGARPRASRCARSRCRSSACGDADELFATGAVRGVEPVRAVYGMRDWLEGSITPRGGRRAARPLVRLSRPGGYSPSRARRAGRSGGAASARCRPGR